VQSAGCVVVAFDHERAADDEHGAFVTLQRCSAINLNDAVPCLDGEERTVDDA
jgi:uncharacterized membrane protein